MTKSSVRVFRGFLSFSVCVCVCVCVYSNALVNWISNSYLFISGASCKLYYPCGHDSILSDSTWWNFILQGTFLICYLNLFVKLTLLSFPYDL